MAFYTCPKCGSNKVENVPLNTENGYPTDGTYQGLCLDCWYEEPYAYNEKGWYYLISENQNLKLNLKG